MLPLLAYCVPGQRLDAPAPEVAQMDTTVLLDILIVLGIVALALYILRHR